MKTKNFLETLTVLGCALVISAIMGVVTSCGDDVYTENGIRTYLVKDTKGSVIQGATLTLSNGAVTNSNANGIATFNMPVNGSYAVITTKVGYAAMVTYEKSATITLYKTGTTLFGIATLTDEDGTLKPAEEAELELVLDGDFVKKTYKTTTTVSGDYEFLDLPEQVNYRINQYLISIDTNYYYLSDSSAFGTTGIADIPSENDMKVLDYKYTAPQVTFAVVGWPGTVSNIGGDIVIHFSQSVDTTNTNNSIIFDVANFTDWEDLYEHRTWFSNDNKTLTVRFNDIKHKFPNNIEWGTVGGRMRVTVNVFNKNNQQINKEHTILITN
ncbi:hypothetical protein FACS1894199_02470 [Bacteroidia bacterium]|nr:hypothetical protein FACS1894199_02470 [Bacteroidia bacterium]